MTYKDTIADLAYLDTKGVLRLYPVERPGDPGYPYEIQAIIKVGTEEYGEMTPLCYTDPSSEAVALLVGRLARRVREATGVQ